VWRACCSEPVRCDRPRPDSESRVPLALFSGPAGATDALVRIAGGLGDEIGFNAFSWQPIGMSRAAAVDVEAMTADERLELIEALWNSLEDRGIDVTPAQARELQARTDALRAGRLECAGIDETLELIRTKRVPR